MKIVGLCVVFAGVFFFEAPRMIKLKMWRELAVFSGLMALGMSMAFAAALGLKMPNPTRLVEAVFNPISDVIQALLK